MNIRKYWTIYNTMLRNSIVRDMNFKMNFWLWVVVEALWFFLQIAFIEVLFSQTSSIGSWGKYEMILLVGTNHLIAQLFQAFFYMSVTEVPELVRTGQMDFRLLQPINSQFAVSMRRFGADSLINVAIGILFVIYALQKLAASPTPAQVVLYAVLVVCGIVIHYSLMFMLVTISFWIVKAQGLVYGYFNLFNIARLPDEIFKGVTRIIFTFVLPMLVVANIPARLLMEMNWKSTGLMVILSLMLLGLSNVFWQFALKRYTSASS